MTPVQGCPICGGAIVGFGNDAWPVNDDRCCDQCNSERVIPTLRLREREAKRERPRSRAAQQRDEVAPSQWIELHSVPAAKPDCKNIESAGISQRLERA